MPERAIDAIKQYRVLGSTGERVSPIGLGRWHLGHRNKVFLMTKIDGRSRKEAALLAKTKVAASRGEFELFKTSSIFDSTAEHPDWLGNEPAHVREMMLA